MSLARQTVAVAPFTLADITYEVGLSEENAAALRDELARHIASGRRSGGLKARVATGVCVHSLPRKCTAS
ncbi:histone-like nucleoid-structuring protein Lsr2 [Amycolatopsis sp. CA-128772]|uniref:Lsr2 dimerization domain-containing protein n=1 Tax=Amycolatopsis sp. CA-128772 TaxID=2073159 RepID=UPI000CD28BCA